MKNVKHVIREFNPKNSRGCKCQIKNNKFFTGNCGCRAGCHEKCACYVNNLQCLATKTCVSKFKKIVTHFGDLINEIVFQLDRGIGHLKKNEFNSESE